MDQQSKLTINEQAVGIIDASSMEFSASANEHPKLEILHADLGKNLFNRNELINGVINSQGDLLWPFSDKVEISNETLIQRRKHRKKRINKKWAKRYGFKKVVFTIKGNIVTPIDISEGVSDFEVDIFEQTVYNKT